ncbi:virulence factor Mce family protein [Mycolicibacterium rufum]|uniref:Virulence factor Mce family protein n=1 Tax=Mycolicibacterium rufum TaxID=318424 RepID=A0A9X2YGY8_9MYCO|nr:virulence factor Mce family protein [Mycolicibacterium rufum]KGI66253.1 mammalian cell entry protein [Mycolicibacterium rufum]MCV7073578.1 virulence factor Mce family protein [Mycolicibacterium rufum]ULP37003.1 virulence factor Mce family protein [Mycolicibacterium rufum]
MSTIFNVRNLRVPGVSRTALVVGIAVLVIAIVGAFLGWNLYKRLTTNTVVAYFSQTLALYPGDKVQIMGVRVGSIDKIEPAGNQMRVTFHYENKYSVPANATASILNPSLVASRTIQLSPPYTGGPVLGNDAVIPVDRTQVPVEYDELRDSINRILTDLGPTPEQPKGPFGDIIESAADGFAGKGKQLNDTLTGLSEALFALNEGRGDLFSVVKSLALFVNALYKSDQQFVALNTDLAKFTNAFTNTDQELATAVKDLDTLLATTRQFIDKNGSVLVKDIDNLADATNAILQPEPRDGLETALHVFPNLGSNFLNIYQPAHGSLNQVAAFASFANPMQFLCSAIQAGSRLGYQESAELCAQYLGPILDAIKFNFPPFGLNQFSTAATLPKQIAYSEDRLRPPGGYKDTTVPGIFARDTLFSHGNHEPGWVTAPGMQGIDVQPFTANMLTPESLAELMGGPDAPIPGAPPAFGAPPGGNLPGPPNAYDERNPLPPPWYPQPAPPPGPAPGVVPGDAGGSPLTAFTGPAASAPPAPAPAGPLLPAEAGG